MDLNQLRAFVQTAKQGSFSAAAAALGLTQPGISRQVKQLEQELGVALIDREQRPIGLTPAGTSFFPSAEMIVKEMDSATQRLASGATGPAGIVTVAASTIPGEFLVPGLLARFSARFPHVRPSLLIMDSAGVAEALLARKAEVGFLGARTTNRGLHLVPFAEDEIVLVAPANHPLAEHQPVTLSDLAGQPFVERAEGSGTEGSLKRILAKNGLQIPEHRLAMVAGSTQVQLAAIEAGAGLGFVSRRAIASGAHPQVVEVEIAGLKFQRTLYLAFPNEPLAPAAQALVDFVVEQKGH